MRVLVAGITGQLGAGLVEIGDEVLADYLPVVRPMASRGPAARLQAAYPDRPGLAAEAIAGDVSRPLWGIDAATIRRLAVEADVILNIAGETNWAAPRRRLDAVNVLGAVHGYELANQLQEVSGTPKLYCYASSIHAAGGAQGSLPEMPFSRDEHRTDYELSKWLGETVLLRRGRREDGPGVCVARIGGLLGNSLTGRTHRRNSLYMLADRFDELPFGLLPIAPTGRVDMLQRDVAARLLIDALQALHANPPRHPEIVHVCAGEAAPLTHAVLDTLRSLDSGHRRNRPRAMPTPLPTILAVSEQLARYHDIPRKWHNLLIGLRYLSLDRRFERSRLAALIGRPLPAVTIEEIVRTAFELPVRPVAPAPAPEALSLARFTG